MNSGLEPVCLTLGVSSVRKDCTIYSYSADDCCCHVGNNLSDIRICLLIFYLNSKLPYFENLRQLKE